MPNFTPMIEQYLKIKKEYKECILFFRLGDFYEMFFEDAIVASKELEISLTGKDCGQKERAPMCGVPFHSVDSYISRLVEKGYRVAICEQTENPKQAKGIVNREVIRVITPGTIIDNIDDDSKNNYIMCIYSAKIGFGLAVSDVTTGEFLTTQLQGIKVFDKVIDEIAKFNPAEIIYNNEFKNFEKFEEIENRFTSKLFSYDDWVFNYINAFDKLCTHFCVKNLDGFGLRGKELSVCASGALMEFLLQTQKNNLSHISSIKTYTITDYMVLDLTSRRNLELTESIRDKAKKNTLLSVLDKTETSMGARLLRKWIEQPLINLSEINKRLDSVEELKDNFFLRDEIKDILSKIKDFERVMSKIIYKTALCRDLILLKDSIKLLPLLKDILKKCTSTYLKELYYNLDVLEDIYELIQKSINDEDIPVSLHDGNIIKKGYNNDLDVLLNAKIEGKSWLDELESREKQNTGIKNLKIRNNKIFGYYIEVTKSYLELVPDYYIRKQTLANCERFTTKELDRLAELILGAESKIADLEYNLYCEIRDSIGHEVERIQCCASIVSIVDVIQSLAEAAYNNNYAKPYVNNSDIIDIKDGRHPVVEQMSNSSFIANDTLLDNTENQLLIVTGPNMAGKSTYMRQTALIVFMAQIGSFVPASSAKIGIVDRIFTRVGASDDLASGQSTFMVEMTEVANILNNATPKSLLILDEIGRGTSTFDGLSIAWAVLEYIADKGLLGAKSIFATHYHELTELEGKLEGVKNYYISVKEKGEDIIFLRKIERGGADNSYGIQVAKFAGLPNKVIKRSSQILKQLDDADINKKAKKIANNSSKNDYKKCFDEELKIKNELIELDIMSMTPIEALQKLFELQKKVKEL